jgi:outer membrane receptor protein involved in Fe transport
LTVYNLDLRDELDFDIETLRYQNIGKSRHRGIEAALDIASPIGVGGFARYTHQAATHESGDHDGKQLKAIPRNVLSAGVRAGSESGFATSVTATRLWGVHLDDANTLALPAWTRWDARVSWQLGRITSFVQATNLFDAEFNTTGYPDASDPGTVYYYPAAGRLLHVGIRHAW